MVGGIAWGAALVLGAGTAAAVSAGVPVGDGADVLLSMSDLTNEPAELLTV